MRIVALFLLTCLLNDPSMAQQTVNKTAEIDLVAIASCSFTKLDDLYYGTATRPASGSGSVTISATTGSRGTFGGVTVAGSFGVGLVRLSGTHVSSFSVSASFPSTLTRSGGGSLSFARAWAQSTSSQGGYNLISGTTVGGSGGGGSVTRYFRIGGTAGGISLGDPDGTYTGTATLTATCN